MAMTHISSVYALPTAPKAWASYRQPVSVSLNLIAATKELGKIWLGNVIIFEIGKFGVIAACLILVPVGKIHGKMHNGLIL